MVSERLEQKETGRVEAFSDGVFGIAITLLVLDIKVPPVASATNLAAALLRQWPMYLAYVITFLTVLIMWMNHHKLFLHIRRVDHLFLIVNGLLLMSITVTPFTASLLAAYISSAQARVAAAVYSGWFVLIAILYNVIWRYACHRGRLLARDYDRVRVGSITRQYRFGPLMYALAFGLAFAHVAASIGLCLVLAVFFAVPERRRPALQ